MRKPEEALASVPAVRKWLESNGLKVSQAKIYRDITKGALRRQETGEFLESDAEAYAETLLHKPGSAGQVNPDRAALEIRKLQMDIARLEGVVRKQDREYDIQTGKLCESETFYRALSERVALLRSRLRSAFQVRALDYQRMSLDSMIETYFQDLDVALNEYSRPPEYDAEGVPDVFEKNAGMGGGPRVGSD